MIKEVKRFFLMPVTFSAATIFSTIMTNITYTEYNNLKKSIFVLNINMPKTLKAVPPKQQTKR